MGRDPVPLRVLAQRVVHGHTNLVLLTTANQQLQPQQWSWMGHRDCSSSSSSSSSLRFRSGAAGAFKVSNHTNQLGYNAVVLRHIV